MTAHSRTGSGAPDLGAGALVPYGSQPRTTWYRPEVTRWRAGVALTVAITADLLQLLLGPVGWAFSDEVIDVVTMVTTSLLLGFHVLLLPTFVLELLPVTDMLPTWTGCVIAVVVLRRRQARPMA